jgi:hypothetical protein
MAIEEWSILMRWQPIDAPVDLTGGEDAILAGAQTYGGNQMRNYSILLQELQCGKLNCVAGEENDRGMKQD